MVGDDRQHRRIDGMALARPNPKLQAPIRFGVTRPVEAIASLGNTDLQAAVQPCLCATPVLCDRAVQRRGRVRTLDPLLRQIAGPAPQGGVDGQDLAIPDMADHPGLGVVLARDRHPDIEIHDVRRPRIGQVLGGGPHHGPLRRSLQRRDRRRQAHAAEHEHVAGSPHADVGCQP